MSSILVIDDDTESQRVVDQYLGGLGYVPCLFDDCDKAIDYLVTPALVVQGVFINIDLGMQPTTCWEALMIIKEPENWPNLPVAMYSEEEVAEHALKSWSLGAEVYMTKPFCAESINTSISIMGIQDYFDDAI